MSWYRISFTRDQASARVGDLAQDFLDTLQTSETRDGIALYRQRHSNDDKEVVYYLSLNTTRPSRRLSDYYQAEACPPPDRRMVEHFGGDEGVLDLRG